MKLPTLTIDLGSSETKIHQIGAGVVLSEPSVIAISETGRRRIKATGIDAKNFRSTRLTAELIDSSDLIFTMGASHAEAICRALPDCRSKVKCLLELSGGGDVPDPFGGSVEVYRQVFNSMRPALLKLADTMMNKEFSI